MRGISAFTMLRSASRISHSIESISPSIFGIRPITYTSISRPWIDESASSASSFETKRYLQNFAPASGAGQTLQAPNTGSTASEAVEAAVGTTEPPVGTAQHGSGSTAASGDAGAPGAVLSSEELRLKAIKLYKELHRLGRDYPDEKYEFNKRLRRAYEKNAKVTDPSILKKQLELAEHIKKEVLALISLKKFRHLRRSYHANEGPR